MNKWQSCNMKQLMLSRFYLSSKTHEEKVFNIEIKKNYIVIISLFLDKEVAWRMFGIETNPWHCRERETSFGIKYWLGDLYRGAFQWSSSSTQEMLRFATQPAQTQTRTNDSILMSLRVCALLTSSCAHETSALADPPPRKFAFPASNSNALFVINGFSVSVLGNRDSRTRWESDTGIHIYVYMYSRENGEDVSWYCVLHTHAFARVLFSLTVQIGYAPCLE